MVTSPIRRAQLITPFGVGAMVVARDGTSLISGGLDHWYEDEKGIARAEDILPDEYRVEEWRLQRLLGVDHFQLPPDYRQPQPGEQVPNRYLTVPFLRFPQWHFCPGCKRLAQEPLVTSGWIKCPDCEAQKKKRYLVQVPFVAMCDYGHIQDFPWREWVHHTAQPSCSLTLRLVATGGASLGAQKVVCDCGQERSLANITRADPNGLQTELSEHLEEGKPYLCKGHRPWLGTEQDQDCPRPLRGSLRSASNVYYADVRSAIYLPRSNAEAPSALVTLLEEVPLATLISLIVGMGSRPTPNALRGQQPRLVQPYTDAQIESALTIVLAGRNTDSVAEIPNEGGEDREDPETAFRRAEFDALRAPRDEDQLLIRASALSDYDSWLQQYFSRVMLVSKLRETRALAGFTRVFPENDLTPDDRRALLRLTPLYGLKSWLPAYVVYGEGIFLELQESRLQTWLAQEEVLRRIQPLMNQYQKLQTAKRVRPRPVTARLVLMHTLAHLILNQLTFECGYSSAALRERLYVSDDVEAPMAGILIYTAAGDSEGTMGGLVRMGKPKFLEPVIKQALKDAEWCSTDPVCMEMGARGGQGPDSCNLAACHNCSLIPETACELFNRFLDRGVVVGLLDNPTLGFFSTVGNN